MERIFLAQKHEGNGDDGSKSVIAVLTNEDHEDSASHVANFVARQHQAEIIALHDGSAFYKVVRAKDGGTDSRLSVATIAGALMAAGQFTDNQIPEAVQRAFAIVEEAASTNP